MSSERMSGKDLVVLFVHSGGTADLSGNYRELSLTRDSQMADVTAGNDGGDYQIYLRQINSASLTTVYDGTAGTATMGSASVRGASGTLLYAPKGTASGNPKGGFPCVVKSASPGYSYDKESLVTVEFVGQGTELFNPMVDTW